MNRKQIILELLNMLEEFHIWVRENVDCCACGDKLETADCINVVELQKVATWKYPVSGQIDVPGYEPRAIAIVCDKCLENKVKIQRCIEWERTSHQVTYHDVDGLKDSNSMSQIDYYFGRLFRQRHLLRKAARQECEN